MDTLASLDSNVSMGEGEGVRVVVRIRPMNGRESENDTPCADVSDAQTVEVETELVNKSWRFDRCFGPETSQEDFFEDCGAIELIQAALDGYSATMFAYGQTGAGKTHTMTGYPDLIGGIDPKHGVIPRVAVRMFEQIQQAAEGVVFSVRASYLEIYNEQVTDLLNPDGGILSIRWRQSGFFVEDLFVVDIANVEDILAVFEEGSKNRSVGSHNLNRDSSRSHALMTVYVDALVEDPDAPYTRFGKLTFVDLAGSENLKKSGTQGKGIKETGAINKSLFALGNVISALSDSRKRDGHIAYRDSAITKLLADSLGGNSHCLMTACLSPALKNLEDTLGTLHYASRTKSIHNRPIVQLAEKDRVVAHLRSEVEALTAENTFLRQKLASYNDPAALAMHSGGDTYSALPQPTSRSRSTPDLSSLEQVPGSASHRRQGSDESGLNRHEVLPPLDMDTAAASPGTLHSARSMASGAGSAVSRHSDWADGQPPSRSVQLRARATEEYLRRTLSENR